MSTPEVSSQIKANAPDAAAAALVDRVGSLGVNIRWIEGEASNFTHILDSSTNKLVPTISMGKLVPAGQLYEFFIHELSHYWTTDQFNYNRSQAFAANDIDKLKDAWMSNEAAAIAMQDSYRNPGDGNGYLTGDQIEAAKNLTIAEWHALVGQYPDFNSEAWIEHFAVNLKLAMNPDKLMGSVLKDYVANVIAPLFNNIQPNNFYHISVDQQFAFAPNSSYFDLAAMDGLALSLFGSISFSQPGSVLQITTISDGVIMGTQDLPVANLSAQVIAAVGSFVAGSTYYAQMGQLDALMNRWQSVLAASWATTENLLFKFYCDKFGVDALGNFTPYKDELVNQSVPTFPIGGDNFQAAAALLVQASAQFAPLGNAAERQTFSRSTLQHELAVASFQ